MVRAYPVAMSLPFECKQYSPDHLDGVLRLSAAEGWHTYSDDPLRAHAAFIAPGVTTGVALGTSQGQPVGVVSVLSDGVIQAYLVQLVVDVTWRRAGVASALLQYAFSLSGAARLDLLTDTAEVFYAARPHRRMLGFRIYPDASQH